MTDISKYYVGPEAPKDPPDVQLINEIQNAGLTPPGKIIMDGRIHRFNSGSKGRSGYTDKSGWYVAFADGIPAGKFGDWRLGLEQRWRADIGRKLSSAEEFEIARKMEESRKLREAEESQMYEQVGFLVDKIWTEAALATEDHPYLLKKQIKPHGARVTGDGRLIVPLYNAQGEMSSVQYIDSQGNKLYHQSGRTKGCSWHTGTDDSGTIYVAEGYATAATITETTGKRCYITYSAHNIVSVTSYIRTKYGQGKRIVIVADNDESGIGRNHADQASAKYGADVVMPPGSKMDANDYLLSGNDLLALLEPSDNDTDLLFNAKECMETPAPISWLIKGWLQEQSMVMVHGPSGGGKTFFVLDWCLHISSQDLDDRNWAGMRTKHAPVVYLAGEGHHGLRGRVAAWAQHHNVKEPNMWLSKRGLDLNKTEGLQEVIKNIRCLDQPPSLIVVDTLHRHMSGDENSAQDTREMLSACAVLMQEFNCSLILVHHTGVSEEAQHRARGSSAWRGALDIEISVKPGSAEKPIEVIQRKMKDAEMMDSLFFDLQPVTIKGWKTEDNEDVTSVVMVRANAPVVKDKKVSKLDRYRKRFEDAWFSDGRGRDNQGRPYISRSALLEYLTGPSVKMSEAYAKRSVQPDPTRMIGILIDAKYIEPFEQGWSAKSESLILDLNGHEELINS